MHLQNLPKRIAVALTATLIPVAAATASEPTFPENASSRGHGVDELFWLATWSGTVAFAIVVGILIYCIVAFRARPGHRAVFDRGEGRGARTFSAVFAAVVFVVLDVNLAVKDHYVYEEMYGSPPAEEESLVVECLAKQYEWHFRYAGKDGAFGTADDLYTINDLRVPSDRSTVVWIKSMDVIHSFFVPNFRTKQDAVPGMFTMIWLHPAKEGVFDIACAELCGQGHYDMNATVTVQPRDAFDAWIQKQQVEVEEYGLPGAAGEFWPAYGSRKGRP
jgi:cytochrome c oxidase subunit 2